MPRFRQWALAAALLAQAACGGWPSAGAPLGLPSAAEDAPRADAGFNLFTPEQDIELGRLTAREYAAQLRLVEDERVASYVQRLGERLAAHAPGYEFPYKFAVVAAGDVNAFALPGGFVYVNAGAVAEAGSEGELAGVLAHEIAHVALRHGTNQASKAHLAKAGLGALEAVTGGNRSETGRLINSAGRACAESLFRRFNRAAETQADLEGARLLAAAGYDPRGMTRFFAKLEGRGAESAHKISGDHPDPAERVAALERLIPKLAAAKGAAHDSVEFERVKARLSGRVRVR